MRYNNYKNYTFTILYNIFNDNKPIKNLFQSKLRRIFFFKKPKS